MLVLSLCIAVFIKGAVDANNSQFSSVQNLHRNPVPSAVEGQYDTIEYLERHTSAEQVFSEDSSFIVVQDSKCDTRHSETELFLSAEDGSRNENVVVLSSNTKESTVAFISEEVQPDRDNGNSYEPPTKPEDEANVSKMDAIFMWDCLFFFLTYIPNLDSNLDSWLNAKLNTLPATLRKLFTNAPLPLTPAKSLLLFCALCFILSVIFTRIFYEGISSCWCYYKKDLFSDRGFNTERSLVVVEQENEDLKTEVETLKSQLHDHEVLSVTLSTETATLNIEKNTLQKQVKALNYSYSEVLSNLKLKEEIYTKQVQENYSLNMSMLTVKQRYADVEAELFQIKEKLERAQVDALKMQSEMQLMAEELSILQSIRGQTLAESESCNRKMHSMSEELNRLHSEVKVYEESIYVKDEELTELKRCFSQLKLFEDEIVSLSNTHEAIEMDKLLQMKFKDMLDVAKANAKLKSVEDECYFLKTSLSVETETRLKREEHLKEAKEEVMRIMERCREAERQVDANKVKMDVLSTYFKDKEKELNRKLCEQEAREKANTDQLVNTDVRTKEFEMLVQSYKEKIDDLQQEIQKIETDYRRQIAAQEKKAHECWLSARQSEREIKEQKIISRTLKLKTVELQARLDSLSDELRSVNQLKTGPNTANESALSPVMLPNDQPVPPWRGLHPLLVRPGPFFPRSLTFNAGDRSSFQVPFHDMRHPSPVQMMQRNSTDDVRSPRDLSPPLIHSSSSILTNDLNVPPSVPCEIGWRSMNASQSMSGVVPSGSKD